MESMEIQPIDYLVLAGFQERFQQVFGAVKCAYINANDKTKILQRVFGEGAQITYPYAYFEIKHVDRNANTYNGGYMSRRGLVMNINSDSTVQTVRILPCNFELEVTYVTNRFQSVEQGSVMSFVRRWLGAGRNGYLKTSVNYGRLQFGIGVTLDEGLNIPSRGNIVETETSFMLTATATVHGYISEPVLGQKGKVNQFNVNGSVGGINGQIVNTQFFAFPESS
jgi:hypothetical protein